MGRTRTGKAAVAESKAIRTGSDDFYLGSTRRPRAKARAGEADDAKNSSREAPMLYRASGRVFLQAGKDLVEQGLPKEWRKQAVVVEAFTKAYFALLKQKPELTKVLALGERVVFRDGERIVHVKPAAKPAVDKAKKVGEKAAGGKSRSRKALRTQNLANVRGRGGDIERDIERLEVSLPASDLVVLARPPLAEVLGALGFTDLSLIHI